MILFIKNLVLIFAFKFEFELLLNLFIELSRDAKAKDLSFLLWVLFKLVNYVNSITVPFAAVLGKGICKLLLNLDWEFEFDLFIEELLFVFILLINYFLLFYLMNVVGFHCKL